MNKTRLLLLALFIVSSFQTFAKVPYNEWWQKANRFYLEKNYDSAAFYYEKLAVKKPESAEVFYNLGNSYYKLNSIGLAVLNYERALKLKPNYTQAQDNLELTQSRISNRIQPSQDIFFVKWWKAVTKANFAETWAVISVVFFLFILAILALRRWNKAPYWMQPQVGLITTIIFLCTLTFAYISANRKSDYNRAVVMEQNAQLRDNLKSAKTQILIPEGTVLKIESEHAEWVNVKLPDGRNGWMQKESLKRI